MDDSTTPPCPQCPWRRASLPGWLGDQWTPEEWASVAWSDMAVPCHCTMGKGKKKENGCAGLAIFRANICKVPRDCQKPAKQDLVNVFVTLREFIDHHRSMGTKTSAELMREEA